MKFFTTLFAFLFWCLAIFNISHAQTRPGGGSMNGSIMGTVVAAETDEPVPTATVAIWNTQDSTLVTGGITLDNGAFSIDGLRPGAYFARVSFVGFSTQEIADIALRPGALTADLGKIALDSDSQLMGEVEVTAEREFVEIGIDRTVYNTRDQLVSAGGSATNVLENIPSVEVDIDGNISLRGNQNVAVLINGRPSPMTGQALVNYLEGLPADMIERVEVIPNPSAKYEPDGMAGILNLELKKGRDLGISGGVTASAATQGRYNASGNLNYQKGKINLFSSYGFSHSNRDGGGWRLWENRAIDPLSAIDQEDVSERIGFSHNLNSTLDYSFDKKNTLTVSGMMSLRDGDNDQITNYSELLDEDLLTNRFDRSTFGRNNSFNTEYRLAYRRVVQPGTHELNIEADFEIERGEDDGEYVEELFDLNNMEETSLVEQQADYQEEDNREASFQVDFMRPLGSDSKSKLELGMRSELELINSDYFSETLDLTSNVFTPDVQRNNTFNYDIQTHAAYGILGTQFGKFGVQAGVRLEQAFTNFELETTNESFENNYFSVFPSAFVTYSLTEAQSLKLAYSKRINRPRTGGWFNQLNPFDTNADPLFRFVGNPYLNPEYVHSFEFSFTRFSKATSLTVSPYYTYTVDKIRFFQTVDAAGVSTTTFRNFDTSNSWGVETIGTLRKSGAFNAYISFNAFQIVTDGSNVDNGLSNNAFGFSTRFNGTYNVSPTVDVQFSYYYRAPMDIEGGRMDARQSANMAVRQKLFNNKANLSIRVSDIFNTMGFGLVRENNDFFQQINRSFEAQGIGVNFSYNFGKQVRNQRPRRSSGNRQAGPDEGGYGM